MNETGGPTETAGPTETGGPTETAGLNETAGPTQTGGPTETAGPTDTASLVELADAVILGGGARLTPAEVWVQAGVPEELARELWLAMGFPHVPDDERSLSERDVRALRLARQLADGSVFAPDRLRHQTRIMSQALSTVASAHAEVFETLTTGSPAPAGRAGALADAGLLDTLDELLAYLYRRHLLAALERLLLVDGPLPGGGPAPLRGVVGFADLTRFTSTAADLSESELTVLIDDFATLAADMVASVGGRVVKLIGDEVMFTVEDPERGGELILGLVEAAAARPDLPPVHAGLALGPLLGHHGDLFGPTVNLASRLTDVARPGTVLVNDTMADRLAASERFRLRPLQLRRVKGIGTTEAAVLRWGEAR